MIPPASLNENAFLSQVFWSPRLPSFHKPLCLLLGTQGHLPHEGLGCITDLLLHLRGEVATTVTP